MLGFQLTYLVQCSNGPRKKERDFCQSLAFNLLGPIVQWSNGPRRKERDFFQSLAFNLLGPIVQWSKEKRERFFSKLGFQLTWSNSPMVQGKKRGIFFEAWLSTYSVQ